MQNIFLFDTDGVLVHSKMWSEVYCERTWLAPSAMKPFFTWIFQDCIVGKADLKDVIEPHLSLWWWNANVVEYLHEWFSYENKPDTLLIEHIQELRKSGHKCYVATNQEKYRLNYLRDTMKFWILFDGIFCSAEIGKKKPEEWFYKFILGCLWVTGDKIIYFDDDEKNILSAEKLGIKSIHYKDKNDFIKYTS